MDDFEVVFIVLVLSALLLPIGLLMIFRYCDHKIDRAARGLAGHKNGLARPGVRR